MGVNSLPETATRQRRDCDLNPGPSAPESSTLTTRLPSHPTKTNNEHNMSKWYDDTGEQLFGSEKVLTERPAVAVHGRQHSLQPSHYTPQTHRSITTVTRGKYWPTDEYVSSAVVPVCTALKPTVSRLTTTEFYDKLVTKSSKALAGVQAELSPMLGGRWHCVIPYGMWVRAVVWHVADSYTRLLHFT